MPTESSTTSQTLPTDERLQGDLLLDYDQKFSVVRKFFSLHLHRKELCSSRSCIMDARVLPTLRREHPSTILAESTGKPVAVERVRDTCCGNNDFKSTDHMRLSKHKMTPARKESKN